MDLPKLITALERFGTALPAIVAGVDAADAQWKPDDGAWSIVEVVSHLADEEVFDFRARLQHLLVRREGDWPAIDPEGWAVERHYNDNLLPQVVECFVRERAASVAWLRSFKTFDTALSYQHPKWGPMTAGLLMASWPAHDALHLRQIAKRMHQLAAVHGEPYSTMYAGDWKA